MKRLLFGSVFAAVLAVAVLAFSQGTKHTEAFPGPDNPNLAAKSCLAPGLARMTINWTAYNNGPEYVALSHTNNGWIWGTYVLEGPLPSGTSSFTPWYGINDNLPVYVLIGTVTQFGLFTSSMLSLPPLQACAPTQVNCNNNWQPGCAQPPSWVDCGGQMTLTTTTSDQGCVWVTRGEGAEYDNGDQVVICYWLNHAMAIKVVTKTPSGNVTNRDGFDDGRGDCIVGTAGEDGKRTTSLFGPNNKLLDTTDWSVD